MPADIVEALVNSPDALKIILKSILVDDYLEHYWGLSIENEKIKIHYEYFGYPTRVPHKFVDKKLIPLHSHVGLNLPVIFANPIKKRLGYLLKDELDMKKRRISGTTHPSHHDLVGFILQGFESFGVCSRYKNYVKISFYDPTKLDAQDLRDVLKEIIEEDEKTSKAVDNNPGIDDIVEAIHRNVTMWNESKSLKILKSKPYSAHLFIPL